MGNEAVGDLPIRNWTQGSWADEAARISGQRMAATILTGKYYCGSCVVGCGREVEVGDGPYRVHGAGPEYETLACLGSLCLVDDLHAIAHANELCNRFGLDTISTGATIAFAMECYERGLIRAADAGGLPLRWGDAAIMVRLVEMIGRREGIGDLLADGVRRAAERIGGLAPEFAIYAKGLEFPAHDPRAYNSLALAYATSNRGACHLQAYTHQFERAVTLPELGFQEVQNRFGTDDKGRLVAVGQDLMCMMDSLKLCKFILLGGVKPTQMLDWLNTVTGWEMDLAEFMRCGERIWNLKRLFNVRCGVSRKDDLIPSRILTHRRGSGGAAENLPPLGPMLAEYYAYRGWDAEGIPTAARLQALDIPQRLWAAQVRQAAGVENACA